MIFNIIKFCVIVYFTIAVIISLSCLIGYSIAYTLDYKDMKSKYRIHNNVRRKFGLRPYSIKDFVCIFATSGFIPVARWKFLIGLYLFISCNLYRFDKFLEGIYEGGGFIKI